MLIVDDEPFNLIALEGLISLVDHSVKLERAFNGKEALEIIAKSYDRTECGDGVAHLPIQLIITDNNMPVMTGVSLA